jgi:predicted pyridoxine 5'-phosphate oxidase superfamily flavin-nucleotide-binding protein
MATLLTGAPGFIQTPDAETLRITLPAQPGDPTVDAFARGQEVGVLGLDLATRRRNRANGRLTTLDGQAMTIAVHQSFGNCPQYIQRRTVEPAMRRPALAERLTTLDEAAVALIGQADTLFVASHARAEAGAQGGADISHRGGRPGFVRIDGDVLTIPDFRLAVFGFRAWRLTAIAGRRRNRLDRRCGLCGGGAAVAVPRAAWLAPPGCFAAPLVVRRSGRDHRSDRGLDPLIHHRAAGALGRRRRAKISRTSNPPSICPAIA